MRHFVRAGFGLALGAVFGAALLASTAARAEEDELPDTMFFGTVLRSIGLAPSNGPGIEYRERSPLVIPSKRELPAPEASANAESIPNWPVEPDVKRARELKAATRRNGGKIVDKDMDESRPLRPAELNVGGGSRSSSRDAGAMDPEKSAQQLRPSELGDTDMFSRLFGGGDTREANASFTGESPRNSLTEPPTGYQTPSPNQPYGLGKEKAENNKKQNFYYDHPASGE
jgi:hypothetical protein